METLINDLFMYSLLKQDFTYNDVASGIKGGRL